VVHLEILLSQKHVLLVDLVGSLRLLNVASETFRGLRQVSRMPMLDSIGLAFVFFETGEEARLVFI